MTPRIVSIGAVSQDIYLIDRDDFIAKNDKISVGTKVDIDKVSYEVGGSGANVAVTFARHGFQSILIGNVGKDSASDAIKDWLIDENVDTSYLSTVKQKTGVSVVLLDSKSKQRTIMSCLGASGKFSNLSSKDLDLANPDWIYLTSLNGDMETILNFFEKAKEEQIKIMFSPGIMELRQKKQFLGLLQDVDVLILNKKEAQLIVTGEILEELLSRLSPYVSTVIITDGQNGAIATNGKETYRLAEYEPPKIADITGAGDAFGSGFLAGVLEGKNFKDSLIAAAANSTSVISQIGAEIGILSGGEKLHPMPIQKLDL